MNPVNLPPFAQRQIARAAEGAPWKPLKLFTTVLGPNGSWPASLILPCKRLSQGDTIVKNAAVALLLLVDWILFRLRSTLQYLTPSTDDVHSPGCDAGRGDPGTGPSATRETHRAAERIRR